MVRKETENHVSYFFVTAFPSQFNNLHQMHSQHLNKSYANGLPFSCFRRFLLLHILTAHTDRIMATIKNRMPPTTPAVMACKKIM